MLQTEQTILGEKGNCFAACVASILELPIEEVPNFGDESPVFDWSDWMRRWQEWLAPRNLGLSVIHYFDGQSNSLPRGYSILSAKSTRLKEKDLNHAVVCFDGAIVFDPHPQRDLGVGAWEYFYVFNVLDPTLFVRKVQAKCPECEKVSLRHEFKATTLSCEDCGSHDVFECPECAYLIDPIRDEFREF